MLHIPGVLRVIAPGPGRALPVLVDSPHSGRVYPEDFAYVCGRVALEMYEDRHVDQLVTPLAGLGARVVLAEAPRSYIDLNRAASDFDAGDLSGGWSGTIKPQPSDYTKSGIGLIWTRAHGDTPIYATPPTAAEVQARIDRYYVPYYDALAEQAALLKARFGRFYHLNVHSMPANTNRGLSDIVLGNLDGRSCSVDMLELVGQTFEDAGLRVAYNQPYKGARLTELFGRPAQHSESVQVEINKRLYLKPNMLDIDHARLALLAPVLERLVSVLGDYGLNTPSNVSRKAASSASMDTRLPSAASEVTL